MNVFNHIDHIITSVQIVQKISFQRWQQQHTVYISCREEQLAKEFDKYVTRNAVAVCGIYILSSNFLIQNNLTGSLH